MVTYKVVDPSDRLNPLDAQLLTRSLIYHGTRSLFCKSIEKHGLSSQRLRSTYGPAIERVVAACKAASLHARGLCGSAGAEGQRGDDQHREGRTSSQQLANHANTTGVVVGAFAGLAPPAVRKRGDRSVRNARESASRRCGILATMAGNSYSNT